MPSLVQEQHDLIQNLLQKQQYDEQGSQLSNNGTGHNGPGDRGIDIPRNQMNSAGINSGIRPSQLSHNRIRRPSLRKRVSQDSLGSPEHGYNDSLDTNESH